MQDRLVISDYVYSKSKEKPVIYPLRFKTHDGWYPLIAIPISYKGESNPYFQDSYTRRVTCRVTDRMNLGGSGYPIKYRKGRHYGGPVSNIYSGFFSAMATRGDFDYMPSALFGIDKKYRMKAELDIFCLGVVKISRLPQVEWLPKQRVGRYVNRRNIIQITYEMKDVKILVSEEKLRKSLFMKHNYTATVRTNILNQIKRNQTTFPLTVEDVSDDYLEGFVIRPNTVRTNSLSKVMAMSNEIKDGVFSNLNVEVV